jgi:hypothetical protein
MIFQTAHTAVYVLGVLIWLALFVALVLVVIKLFFRFRDWRDERLREKANSPEAQEAFGRYYKQRYGDMDDLVHAQQEYEAASREVRLAYDRYLKDRGEIDDWSRQREKWEQIKAEHAQGQSS